jgi:hypothetical protein
MAPGIIRETHRCSVSFGTIPANMNRVRLRQNAFDPWIVVDAGDESKAWSGSRFVPITEHGFPASDVQVSNLDTRDEAAAYAATFGFQVIDTVIN